MRAMRAQTDEQPGRHEAGCFYGGPIGEGYWFEVVGCPLEHDGEAEGLRGTAEGAAAAFEHLRLAGLLRSDESG